MPTPQKDRSSSEIADLGARLDGWKDIATYLGKVERTVKRWDADRCMPTHRVPGGGRASVYAYTRELHEWLKSGKALEGTVLRNQPLMTCRKPNPQILHKMARRVIAKNLYPHAPSHRVDPRHLSDCRGGGCWRFADCCSPG